LNPSNYVHIEVTRPTEYDLFFYLLHLDNKSSIYIKPRLWRVVYRN